MLAPLYRRSRRNRRLVIVLAAAACLPFFGGCDTAANQSNRSARRTIDQVERDIAASTDADAALESARSSLSSVASGVEDPVLKIRANLVLGQLMVSRARDLSWEIDSLHRDMQRLCSEITQLAGQAQLSMKLAEGYGKFDPAGDLAALQQSADAARGGADRAEWAEGSVKLPTLAAVSSQISQLEGQIAQKQQEIDSLEQQRVSALKSSEQSAAEAEAASGRPAVEAFIMSSNARKQASDLGAQIDLLKASLEPLNAQLQIANAQKTFVAAAANNLGEQAAAMQKAWADLQRVIGAQGELARNISAGTGGVVQLPPVGNVQVLPGGSIAEKGAKLAELSTRADELRNRAITMLDDAAKHLGDAATTAIARRGELERLKGERPGASASMQQAWDGQRNALSPSLYQVDQAEAFRLLGSVHMGHAAMLDARSKAHGAVAAAVEAMRAGKVTVPDNVMPANDIDNKYQNALREAGVAFAAADELLDKASSAPRSPGVALDAAAASAARVSRIYTLYGWSLAAKETGDTQNAEAHMAAARDLVTGAVQEGARLPMLPPTLQAVADAARPAAETTPTQPSETPGTQPGETPVEGATQPAEGETTQPSETPPETPPGGPG